jgi:hypothetical protein
VNNQIQEMQMNFVNEYALLFAVALPVVAIVGIQVYLFVSGERDTLLIPGMNRYPSVEYGKVAISAAVQVAPATSSKTTVAEPSNDEMERQAA